MAVPSVQAATQVPKNADMRAPSPVQSTVGQAAWDYVGDDTVTATTSTQQKTYDLPAQADVIEAFINIVATVAGTLTGTGNAYKVLNLVEIFRKKGGTVVWQCKGTDIPNLFLRFSKYNTGAPAGTGATSPISVPALLEGLRLPQEKGPYAIRLTFEAFANLGFGGATGATYSVSLAVKYGDCGTLESHVVFSDILMPNGTFDLAPVFPAQDIALAEIIAAGMAADADLTNVQIIVNGQTVEPNLKASLLQARAVEQLIGTRPTGTYFLLEPTQIAFNRSSHFYVTMSVGTDTVHWLAYWIEP